MHFCKNINYILVFLIFLNYIIHSIFKLYFICILRTPECRVPRFIIFMILIVCIVKKISEHKESRQLHSFLFYMKNIKN